MHRLFLALLFFVCTASAADTSAAKRTLGVLLFPGFEMLDACGPMEIWGNLDKHITLVTIAKSAGPVNSAQGVALVAQKSFAEAPRLDLLLVPGGFGAVKAFKDAETIAWLKERSVQAEITMSVCNGASILAAAGLLDGRPATTNKAYWKMATCPGPKVKPINTASSNQASSPRMKTRSIWLLLFLLTTLGMAAEPVRQTWMVDGVEREALVHVPEAADKPAPLLFFFHGRNGKMAQIARMHPFHQHWPEAIVVYPQGLPTPALAGKGDDLKPGWQSILGYLGDRDLHFFDTMLDALKKQHRIDEKRVYLSGSSNGSGMTFLLWAERGPLFAAIAPNCTSARAMIAVNGEASIQKLVAVPSFHIAGQKDSTVPFDDQMKTIALIREARHLGSGQPWGEPAEPGCTLYRSTTGTPLVTWVHPRRSRPAGRGFPTDGEVFQAAHEAVRPNFGQ